MVSSVFDQTRLAEAKTNVTASNTGLARQTEGRMVWQLWTYFAVLGDWTDMSDSHSLFLFFVAL
jgi:hypothetical protein